MNKAKGSFEQLEPLNPDVRKITSDLKGFFIITASVMSAIVLISISAIVFASRTDVTYQSELKMTYTSINNEKTIPIIPYSRNWKSIPDNPSYTSAIETRTPTAAPKPTVFCPSKDDLLGTWGTYSVFNQGWTLTGGGGVSSKSAYNIIGGSVEYELDFTHVNPGVNANIYSVGATIPATGYANSGYCDGSKSKIEEWCVEYDWIESNGQCGGATTLHTIIDGGPGCTAWGCGYYYKYNGQTRVTMKVSFDNDGNSNISYGNITFSSSDFNYTPKKSDLDLLVQSYKTKGALITSTQWVGWVPIQECGGNGDIEGSMYTVRNLRITGHIVQGPIPNICPQ